MFLPDQKILDHKHQRIAVTQTHTFIRYTYIKLIKYNTTALCQTHLNDDCIVELNAMLSLYYTRFKGVLIYFKGDFVAVICGVVKLSQEVFLNHVPIPFICNKVYNMSPEVARSLSQKLLVFIELNENIVSKNSYA